MTQAEQGGHRVVLEHLSDNERAMRQKAAQLMQKMGGEGLTLQITQVEDPNKTGLTLRQTDTTRTEGPAVAVGLVVDVARQLSADPKRKDSAAAQKRREAAARKTISDRLDQVRRTGNRYLPFT